MPDLNYINEYKIIKDKNIYISTFPKGKNICSFKGKIKEINNDEFIHTANAIEDSSGSPIFLENSKNVIGINKQGGKDENFADFIFTIINQLEKDEQKNKKDKNDDSNKKYNNNDINMNSNQNLLNFKNNQDELKKDINKEMKSKEKILPEKEDFLKYEENKKYIYENGDYYIGQWLNGKKHGKGIKYSKNGSIIYEVDFANGVFEGIGKYIW